MIKKITKRVSLTSIAILSMSNAMATDIQLSYDPTEFASAQGQQALQGFQEAANFWSELFSDNVTVNLGIGFDALDAGIIGSTGSSSDIYYYQDVANAMQQDISSVFDNAAVSSLPCEDQGNGLCNFSFLDQENPSSPVSPELDNDGSGDNLAIELNQANAKALGLGVGLNGWQALDGEVTFSSNFDFDFDRTDGINANQMDFVGVAIHEIGHALGFVSGVDIYDIVYNSGLIDPNIDLDGYAMASALDLFRFSEESILYGVGTRDLVPGSDSYFSLDGGVTNLAPFSTGVYGGDTRQASHFKDDLGIGIMDPTFALGEFGDITAFDAIAFDVIGWDLRMNNVSEPATISMFALLLLGALRRKQNKL